MEQTQHNLLYRWFIGLAMDDAAWMPTVFTKNRERLIEHDAVIELLNEVLAIAQEKDWLSGEHFSVDVTLIQAWAGHKSLVCKDGSDDDGGNVKGKSVSELRYMGHTLSDNRHGLIANAVVTTAGGYAQREAAKAMIHDACQAMDDPDGEITLGADKGYDAQEFIEALQEMNVTPHVAQNTSGRSSAVPDAIAASVGYEISQQKRKLIEQSFGWGKTIGLIRQVMVRGIKKDDQLFVLTMAAYNLTRSRSLPSSRSGPHGIGAHANPLRDLAFASDSPHATSNPWPQIQFSTIRNKRNPMIHKKSILN